MGVTSATVGCDFNAKGLAFKSRVIKIGGIKMDVGSGIYGDGEARVSWG